MEGDGGLGEPETGSSGRACIHCAVLTVVYPCPRAFLGTPFSVNTHDCKMQQVGLLLNKHQAKRVGGGRNKVYSSY